MEADPVYAEALRLLAGRELSEAQLRGRLLRRGHAPAAVDATVARLREERAVDDARAAEAIARREASGRQRGPVRVRMAIARAGIDRTTANRALEEAFRSVDDNALLESALAKRLRPAASIADDRQLHRLYRYLIAQGFDPERVLALLKTRRER